MKRKITWEEQADCSSFEKPEHFAGPPKGKSDVSVGDEVPQKKNKGSSNSSKQPVQKPAAAPETSGGVPILRRTFR